MNTITIPPTTDLLIIGAGAAGLMAAATAAEAGLRALLLESKHQPGRKLLMCANNRCNITNALDAPALLAAYGEPVASFLRAAVQALPPRALRKWFDDNNLPTRVHKDGKVFPASEKAADVLHAFTDHFRRYNLPTLFNCAAKAVKPMPGGFIVEAEKLVLSSRYVLIATGGVSYPKTGSTGDGQNIARALGHKLVPYRPGLVGFDLDDPWLGALVNVDLPACTLHLLQSDGGVKASTSGQICLHQGCIRGPATVDISRIVARQNLCDYRFAIDCCPELTHAQVLAALQNQPANSTLAAALAPRFLPAPMLAGFCAQLLQLNAQLPLAKLSAAERDRVAAVLKALPVQPRKVRPLKEAMVTIGGVSLSEIDPATMQSRRCPGLFFAGEVMDIDGPTGGFNLHAAFATARLAVQQLL